MADILAELEGILGADQVAKLRGNEAVATRLQRGESIREFYDGNMEGEPPPAARRADPPPPAATAGGESLTGIMSELRGVTERLGKIDETVATKVNEVVEKRGGELIGNAVATAMRNTLDVLDVSQRNREELGEPLDRAKLEAHAKAAQEAGRPFRTVQEAWEDMTRQARMDKEIDKRSEERTREKLKERANASLPGVSGTGGSPMLRILRKGPTSGAGGEQTAVNKAARALEDRLSERGEVVA